MIAYKDDRFALPGRKRTMLNDVKGRVSSTINAIKSPRHFDHAKTAAAVLTSVRMLADTSGVDSDVLGKLAVNAMSSTARLMSYHCVADRLLVLGMLPMAELDDKDLAILCRRVILGPALQEDHD